MLKPRRRPTEDQALVKPTSSPLHAAMTSHSTMGGDLTLPDFLDWIAERLVNIYGESPAVDFVQTARKFASTIRAAMAPTEDPDSPTSDYKARPLARGTRAYLADALFAFSVGSADLKAWDSLTEGQRGAWITKAHAVPSVAGLPCRLGSPVYVTDKTPKHGDMVTLVYNAVRDEWRQIDKLERAGAVTVRERMQSQPVGQTAEDLASARPDAVTEDPPRLPALSLPEALALDARAQAIFDGDQVKELAIDRRHWSSAGSDVRIAYRQRALALASEAIGMRR